MSIQLHGSIFSGEFQSTNVRIGCSDIRPNRRISGLTCMAECSYDDYLEE